MNNPLGVSPSKRKQGTTRGKEKIFLTSVNLVPRVFSLASQGKDPGNEVGPRWESNPRTTSGLDLPLLCRLRYKVAQRKSGTILDGESRRRESKGTSECCAA